IASDRQFFASRAEALARGYRSCAAFPLRLQGCSIGVFIVYSREPLYFDDEELGLLTGLADNFSFAIDSRRKARALRESEAQLRAVIDNEPQCVATISLDAKLLEMNPAGLRTLQAPSLEAVVGRPVADFVTRRTGRDTSRSMPRPRQAAAERRSSARLACAARFAGSTCTWPPCIRTTAASGRFSASRRTSPRSAHGWSSSSTAPPCLR
ncbi:MAG: hypothetical protein JWQ33_1372, partial [Ramlibacter sp.]|nr:hypothetical protein [Ramlibacter sp.]